MKGKKKPQKPSAQPGWTVMAALMGSERVVKDKRGKRRAASLSYTLLDAEQNFRLVLVKLNIGKLYL